MFLKRRAGRTLRAGDIAPDFILPDIRGGAAGLSRLLKAGPVVLSFLRGTWCPYCRLELGALAAKRPAIETLGAALVALLPQESSVLPAEIERLPFALLRDRGARTAAAYGLTLERPDVNEEGESALAAPATYIVDRDSRIVLSFIDVDYRNRLEPGELIAALAGLAARDRA